MIRDYGWYAGCLAAGVTDAGVGSGDWFGACNSMILMKRFEMDLKSVI